MTAISWSTACDPIDYLRLMMMSREGDRREGILLRQSKGWFHVGGSGHEALGALAHTLVPEDYVFPYYRDRSIALARGITNYELALAYFAKRASSSGGRQMPGHYSDRKLNIFSVCTPTGASLLPACGAAWAMKLEGKSSLCLASVGDAASRQGEFFEALAFAIQERLPVVFLVEDNKFGISTPTEKFLPMRLGLVPEERVLSFDARDPETVYLAGLQAAELARSGGGPTVLWADLDRLSSHTSSDDHRVYRDLADIEAMMLRDPVELYSRKLIEANLLDSKTFEEMLSDVRKRVDEDYLCAEREADPQPCHVLCHSFAGQEAPVQATQDGPALKLDQRMTMVTAINETFQAALREDPKVIFFGEDIEDPKGGVFGLTKGLSKQFPTQVFNSPLAEATLMGVAVGMAAYGFRPVFELQFIDFIAPGWNQITTNMSSLRWRTEGAWTCPCVVYAPYGAYLPGGSLWHSQSNESYLAHTPGIRLAVPSTPEDAAGLFWSAIHGSDPTFILVPKHIFRKPTEIKNVAAVPFGKARKVRTGKDVTVVAWGNCIELASQVAESSSADCEIIDLRSLVPCDYEAIEESVAKTGRLIVIQEDNRTCGFGQAIISEMLGPTKRWNLFLSPPQLVSRPDVHVGYNPIFEYAALPDISSVEDAIRIVME